METLFQFCAGLFFLNHSTFFVVCPVACMYIQNVVEKLIYFSNSTQIVKLVY